MTETRRFGARGRPIVGAFFIAMGGVHIGVVGADPETYRHFADQALFGFVRDGWSEVFMADQRCGGYVWLPARFCSVPCC
jgi:hypothetical protein